MDQQVWLCLREPMTDKDAGLLSPLQLAWLGDSVHSLMVRTALLAQGQSVRHGHQAAIAMVSAGAQSSVYAALEGTLTPRERDILLRGRNTPLKHAPKNQSPGDYARATGVEAVLGYLFLTGQRERIVELTPYYLGLRGGDGIDAESGNAG